jgi:hypothetical protein
MRLAASCLMAATLLATDADAGRPTACVVSFNGPDEVGVFTRHLGADFDLVDLRPTPAAASSGRAEPWVIDACRPDLHCDVVVLAGEFGGRFFGTAGFSLGLQELEEASCRARCRGLFAEPREVFLLACNTLATKDQDERTPREYLRVLLDHGFDEAAAERVVQMRYGPVGPSFRESLRRVFMGVPRLYGFASVAPVASGTAPRLERYLASVDYAAYLARTGRDTAPNRALLRAFAGTDLVQATGLAPDEPGAADREAVCRLYDEDTSVEARLGLVRELMARPDFLAFLPSMEVFFGRHPVERMSASERALLADMQAAAGARDEVLRLVRDLEMSTVKLEVAHFALHMGWTTREEFRRLAVDTTRALLARPFTSEIADIVCETAKHEPIGDEIGSDDLHDTHFQLAEGLRLVDCIAPTDPRVTARLAASLESDDASTRAWAAYALSRRLPLDEPVLLALARHLDDPSPELRERVRWILATQRPLPAGVREAARR